MRDHLQAYEERNGFPHPMLDEVPALPRGCGRLWHDFLELHGCRGQGRIPYSEIQAYQAVTGRRFRPWEIGAIRAADHKYMDHLTAKRKRHV